MKKLALAALGAVAFASSAVAADLPARVYTKAPPPAYIPPQIYNWTGFYIGGHVGGAFGGSSAFGNNDGRFLGGVQVGADYQFASNWVLGIEGQYSWTDRNTSSVAFVPGGFTISDRASNLGSVTARLGYAWGPALLYVKGGVGFRDGNGVWDTDTLLGTARPFTVSRNTVGYTVGTGLEYMFTPNWSGKVEYQYYNFGKTNVTDTISGTTIGYTPDVHTVKAGINYRFNWGG
ncbi:porin family protein [Bradyrhizobium sp. U87765 SZCCT0131]|uniref:outer membrane protein n=1 Tax=unclassified Bradyrhizobium TaxID=2631580 RepID=UPI001BA9971D|nr:MULTISPECIES: outer membrane beta-barrel protein [unclassified Bradyrhizobium]MBR1222280.1 porin family protein [Bradyrhizobium sp. U87765 SZCCT0131]MBR1264236.1 porin family protein [Bradyrhizobium sp. U87765 SZCCT0134]MBR1307981.1 porin family protein [Bradyrhizobium sp. U87765 SZCCT0110]MBR1320486.1 porin family protein [Bradyrhizobium sp. U87765 SZCCT0109]MBR1348401.1 porin family protein [Bradyrhizobium sp. U87765 SZCCT0048]